MPNTTIHTVQFNADCPSSFEQYVNKEFSSFIEAEDLKFIVNWSKGKNVSVSQYRLDSSDLHFNMLDKIEGNFQHLIIEVPSVLQLEKLYSITQLLLKFCAPDARIITSISNNADSSVKCTFIKACDPSKVFSRKTQSPVEAQLHQVLDMMGCHTGRQLLYGHMSYYFQSKRLQRWKQKHQDADSEIMVAVDQMLSCLTAEKYRQHIKESFYKQN